jgi:hypothetical protein
MTYHVLPNFLRQREQRLVGLVTPFQVVAGLGCLLPLMIAAQVSVWLVPPVLALAGVAVYALTPSEGQVVGLRWFFKLRAVVLSRELYDLTPFVAEEAPPGGVPLVLWGEGQDVALAVEVES